MTVIELVARYVAETRFEDIPEQTVEKQKDLLIDTLGVAVAGSRGAGVAEVVDFLKDMGGKKEARLWVYGGELPALHAAMANSLMTHAPDFDDTHEIAGVHANVCVIPAAIAVAEKVGGIDGRALLTAIIIGVDLICRLGVSIPIFTGWHATATFGIFGAAAAAAKLIGLDETGVADALGIAYSQASGTRQARLEGTLSKRLQPALAVKNGVLSALLSERGMTGPHQVLEGDWGMLRLYTGPLYAEQDQAIAKRLTQDLGKTFHGDGLSVKPYPCCKATHTAISGVLQLMDENHLAAEQIEKVEVFVSPGCYQTVGRPFVIKANPQVDAQFSIPYTVATAILTGNVGLEDFVETKIREPRRAKLAENVIVSVDAGLEEPSSNVVNLTSRIAIHAGGKTYRCRSLVAKGHPEHPMDRTEVTHKFEACLKFGAGNIYEKRKEISAVLVNLESLKDVRMLTEALC